MGQDTDMVYPIRFDRPTYEMLQTLAASSDRSVPRYVKHLIKREAQAAGLLPQSPGETPAQPDRRVPA
jgi:hypothetical protein